jgi:hypothetical protein
MPLRESTSRSPPADRSAQVHPFGQDGSAQAHPFGQAIVRSPNTVPAFGAPQDYALWRVCNFDGFDLKAMLSVRFSSLHYGAAEAFMARLASLLRNMSGAELCQVLTYTPKTADFDPRSIQIATDVQRKLEHFLPTVMAAAARHGLLGGPQLLAAVESADVSRVELLLKLSPDTDLNEEVAGQTALSRAAAAQHRSMAELLVGQNAAVTDLALRQCEQATSKGIGGNFMGRGCLDFLMVERLTQNGAPRGAPSESAAGSARAQPVKEKARGPQRNSAVGAPFRDGQGERRERNGRRAGVSEGTEPHIWRARSAHTGKGHLPCLEPRQEWV